jgi:hypothetical protein
MAAIQQPQIVYNPGGGAVTLAFKRGPQNFKPYFAPRLHDNLATSGAARERVVENADILISFEMQHVIIDDDMPGWEAFMAWALPGGQFKFYPNAAMTDFYNCVDENGKSEWAWTAPKKYKQTFLFRILQDGQAPPDTATILRRFYGNPT